MKVKLLKIVLGSTQPEVKYCLLCGRHLLSGEPVTYCYECQKKLNELSNSF